LSPSAKVVKGFKPIMPVFQGLVSEEQLTELVAYVKSLSAAPSAGTKVQESKVQ
jgi:cytochrome c oxidase subunit 2